MGRIEWAVAVSVIEMDVGIHFRGDCSADAQHTDQSCRHRGARYRGKSCVREPDGHALLEPSMPPGVPRSMP